MPNKRLAPGSLWILWLLVVGLGALMTVPACGCSVRDRAISTPAVTATSASPVMSTLTLSATWTRDVTQTPEKVEVATQAPTLTATPAPTTASTRASTQTPASMPLATLTNAVPPTLTPVPTVTPTSVPTPIVCNDLGVLTEMDIAPGQPFECTAHQDTITEELRTIPEVPCGDVSILFENGQFSFVCEGRLTVTVTGTVAAQECQINVQITGGTPGVGGAMQILIDTLLNYFPYDKLCFERAELADGELIVGGYGR